MRTFPWRRARSISLLAMLGTAGGILHGAGGKAPSSVTGLSLPGLDGRSVPLCTPGRATVALFLSTQCPITNRYTPRILALQREYGHRGARFIAVYPNGRETDAEVRASAKARGYTFEVVRDPGARIAQRLGATVTPEAVLLGASGEILYRGGIDDNPESTRVRRRALALALDAALAGRSVRIVSEEPIGCRIEVSRPARLTSVTYAGVVQPILRSNCEPCHHPGEAAPFSLTSYRQAQSWAPMIKRLTSQRVMPPWKPEPGYGSFRGERRLTAAQIATLAKWADAGAPLGDPKKVLPPQVFPKGWTLGEPDTVIRPDTPYHLAADGDDVYRCYSVDPKLATDRWLSAVEVHPGNRAVVHHVIVYLDPNGASKALDEADPEPGYRSSGGGVGFDNAAFLGGWAPGHIALKLPDGVAMPIPKGARLVIQVHYHKNGQPQTDLTRVGLFWAPKPVDQPIHINPILNAGFTLPPGQRVIPVHAEQTIPIPIHVWGVIPHMHNLGRTMQAVANLPDGRKVRLIRIGNWDFNWQDAYIYRQPLALPRGSKISVDATYDNSEDNPKNPNHPPKPVRWGEQTTDEMCLMYVIATADEEHLLVGRR